MEYNKKIIISGSVGVGKTTTINDICKLLNIYNISYKIIPEYIDGDINGRNMLDKCINKKITAFEFQKYIINYFDIYLNNLKVNKNDIIIFERLPDESVMCFANIDRINKVITEEEFNILYNMCIELDKKYNIPSYFDKLENTYFKLFKTDNNNVISSKVLEILNNCDYINIIIGLYNNDYKCLMRIKERNRSSEVNSYSLSTIKQFNNIYKDIFSKINNNKTITI